MATVNEVYAYLDTLAPFATQMSFDNAGFLVGRGEGAVEKILVALDITEDVVDEAAELGAQLIVSHHPVIFQPVKALTDGDSTGRILLALAQKGIAAICAHTNLDAAQGGVNDVLARTLGLTEVSMLETAGEDARGAPYGIGRVGVLPGRESPTAEAYAAQVKRALNAASVRFVDTGRPVRRVAVGGGACGDMLLQAAEKGCDTFVTADVKYHSFLEARALGLNLMDAGHFPTEHVICPVLERALRRTFPTLQVQVSIRHTEVFRAI